MRKTTVVVIASLFMLGLGGLAPSGFAKNALVRVYFENPEHLKRVVTEFDDVASWGGNRYADIVVAIDRLAELNSVAPENEILIADIDKRVQELGILDVGSAYHTYEEAYAEMDSVADAHPSICRIDSIGTTIEGRTIWAMKISDNVSATENEPRVFYVGNHHAREIITVEIPLYIMHYFADNYGTDARATRLVDNREIWIVPTINPDGREYVQNVYNMWRKNRRNNGDGSYGVDLNRNYGYMWGYDDEGSSPTPSDETYRGSGPFSEPEIQAVRDFALDYQFSTCLTYHSYGKQILYPWGYTALLTPDQDVFYALGDSMQSFNGYLQGPAATTIYVTNGDTDDWMYGEQVTKEKVFSYTFEVGTQFLPPASQILTLCQEVFEPSILVAEYADAIVRVLPPPTPELDAVGDDDDGEFTVSWTVGESDTSNAPVAYALMERLEPSRATDNAEVGGVNLLRDGFSFNTTRYHSATQSFYGGKTNNRDARLTARIPLDVAPSDTLVLWCWYNIETNWDYAYVEVSTDGGWHFASVPGNITTDYNPNGSNLGNGITGSSGAWVEGRFPLTQFADSTVVIRIRYRTDAATLGEGFYADDILPIQVFDSSSVVSDAITETHYDLSRSIGTYYYEVKAKDGDGQWGYLSNRESMSVTGAGVGDISQVVTGLGFANPARWGSKVAFRAPSGAGQALSVFDVQGRLVSRIALGSSGEATWDLKDSGGKPVNPGIYFVRFDSSTGGVKKLVILK